MKKIAFFAGLLAIISLIYAFVPSSSTTNANAAEKPDWVDWETAVERNKTDKRPFIVDIYTDWCGFCKKMDRTTFTDPEVIKYINEHFHAIKFNAEQKEPIVWEGKTFEWVNHGRRGVNTLAASLLDGKLGYPSFVYLNEDMQRIMIAPGYKTPEMIMKELVYSKEKIYNKTPWQEYSGK